MFFSQINPKQEKTLDGSISINIFCMMKEIKSVYIVTKPLQYINCTNIPQVVNNNVCCLCDQFEASRHFYELCKNDGKFNDYIFFKTKEKALLYWLCHQIQIKNIYLDSDFGLVTRFILLILFGVNVYIYEEGYASYQSLRGRRTLKDRILLRIQSLLDIKNYNGGSCKVKGIYLYNKDKYNKAFPDHNKILLDFSEPFFDAVGKSLVLEHLSKGIDWNMFNGKKILIYLSSWNISTEAIDYCFSVKNVDIKILKLHPNIKVTPSGLAEKFDIVLPSNIMFEYFYSKVRNIVDSLTIVHHNTFAVEYIDEKDKTNSLVL